MAQEPVIFLILHISMLKKEKILYLIKIKKLLNKMLNNLKDFLKTKFIACLLIVSQVVYVLPAEAIMQEKNYGKMRLEQYLSWADREKEVEDWERIADEGVLAAMSEWESANTYLKETDYEEYISNRNEVLEDFKSTKNIEYLYW